MGLIRLLLPALLCATLAACAHTNTVKAPQAPNNAVLERAATMLEKADAAGADRFAPDVLSSARHRLTVARMILYRKAGPSVDEAERKRVERLAEAAYLDAKLALVKAQIGAVARQSARLASRIKVEQQQASSDEDKQ